VSDGAADDTDQLLLGGQDELLAETTEAPPELLESTEQGPPGIQGEQGIKGEKGDPGVDFVSDPLAYYILAKS